MYTYIYLIICHPDARVSFLSFLAFRNVNLRKKLNSCRRCASITLRLFRWKKKPINYTICYMINYGIKINVNFSKLISGPNPNIYLYGQIFIIYLSYFGFVVLNKIRAIGDKTRYTYLYINNYMDNIATCIQIRYI